MGSIGKEFPNKGYHGFNMNISILISKPEFTPRLEKLNNIIMTPHITSASLSIRELMSVKAAQNIIDCIEERTPEGLINKNLLKNL